MYKHRETRMHIASALSIYRIFSEWGGGGGGCKIKMLMIQLSLKHVQEQQLTSGGASPAQNTK